MARVAADAANDLAAVRNASPLLHAVLALLVLLVALVLAVYKPRGLTPYGQRKAREQRDLVQSKRDAKAAKRFLRKLLKKQCRTPRVLVSDKLRSYGAAHRQIMRSVEHRCSKYLNNRAEHSHRPTRQRERALKGSRSPGAAQKFLSAFSAISPHFRPRRHRLTAADYRNQMTIRFTIWNEITRSRVWP